MKKLFCYLLVYIGVMLSIFNPKPVLSATTDSVFAFDTNSIELPKSDSKKPIITADNEFIKLIGVFYLLDKLYPEGKINDDITGFLHLVWPTTNIRKIKAIAPYFRLVISIKRRYNYTVNRLKQEIKAAHIFPDDAPIIAKIGEYAPAEPDKRKQTADDEYKISYVPYKYLEYDKGESGEPVRRRDKNYERPTKLLQEELLLAIITFNIPEIVRVLRAYPAYNDGSREKLVYLENGVTTRLLMATAALGPEEKTEGVIEVVVPKGWYINGDFLNPKVKPRFYLDEDKIEDLNIKEYELFYPEAFGVVNNGETQRVLTGIVKFPITFSRRDLSKSLNIRGRFAFTVCRAKTKDCHIVVSHNSLKLRSSVETLDSVHSNYVNLGFARLPKESTQNVRLKQAVYDKNTKKLTVTYTTDKSYSNVVAMAEDAAETSFLNPKYNIKEKEVIATFDTKLSPSADAEENKNSGILNIEQGGPIAVSAAFDEYEALRTVVTPEMTDQEEIIYISPVPNYHLAFLMGLLLNLMPGILYLLQRLLILFYERNDYRKIMCRYALGSACGLAVLAFYNSMNLWYVIYENTILAILALILLSSYCVSMAGFMDFNLYRPFKGKIRRGVFIGLLTVFLSALYPVLFKSRVFDNIAQQDTMTAAKLYITIWLGIITLPLIACIRRRKLAFYIDKTNVINLSYTCFYVIFLLWLIYAEKGFFALIAAVICSALTIVLWYAYPLAIEETMKHRRKIDDKLLLFAVVKKQWSIFLSILIIFFVLIFAFLPQKNNNIPTIDEVQSTANEKLKQNKPLLFMLKAKWSPETLLNTWALDKAKDKIPADVIDIFVSNTDKNAELWLKTYGKNSLPLNVLYTNRHPYGISLPARLNKIDWEEATADFK